MRSISHSAHASFIAHGAVMQEFRISIYNALNISSSQTVDFHLLRRNAKQASLLSILILSPTTERDKPSLYIVGSVLCQWSYIVDLSYASRIFPRYFLPLKIQRMYREKYKFIKQRIAH